MDLLQSCIHAVPIYVFHHVGGPTFFRGLGGHLKIQLFWAARDLNPSCELAITTFLDLVCWFPVFLI